MSKGSFHRSNYHHGLFKSPSLSHPDPRETLGLRHGYKVFLEIASCTRLRQQNVETKKRISEYKICAANQFFFNRGAQPNYRAIGPSAMGMSTVYEIQRPSVALSTSIGPCFSVESDGQNHKRLNFAAIIN
jgi:hypothetical protein